MIIYSNDDVIVWNGIIGSYKALKLFLGKEKVRIANKLEELHWNMYNRGYNPLK